MLLEQPGFPVSHHAGHRAGAARAAWPLLQRLGIGRLPGDIVVEREGFRFYFPIVTSIVVGVVLTPILSLLNR